jgi:acyl carrier protein
MQDVAEDIASIICEQLGVERGAVTPQASFIDDLGADSLAMVELVLAMEERLGISVPEEDTEQIRTVADAITYVQEQQARSAREAS